jgi:FkbM family methyltransferase
MARRSLELMLPNKRVVQCLRRAGVEDAVEEMANYFRHGIEVRPGDTVFDVGANIGLFSVTVFDRCEGDVELFAFEPIPCVYEVLELNAKRCDPARVRTFRYGLSDADKEIVFGYYPRMSVWSSAYWKEADQALHRERNKRALLRSIEEGHIAPWLVSIPRFVRTALVSLLIRRASKVESVSCRVRPCSQIIREEGVKRIDLLKIDVERSELDVLLGIEDEHWPRIRQVVIEVHEYHRTLGPICRLLESKDFVIEYDQDEVQRLGDLGLLYARRPA